MAGSTFAGLGRHDSLLLLMSTEQLQMLAKWPFPNGSEDRNFDFSRVIDN